MRSWPATAGQVVRAIMVACFVSSTVANTCPGITQTIVGSDIT